MVTPRTARIEATAAEKGVAPAKIDRTVDGRPPPRP
jgi:hypothetical protein